LNPPRDTLADLQYRFDGPIPNHLRDAVLVSPAMETYVRGHIGRDIDRLALSTTRSLARLRQRACNRTLFHRLENDEAAIRLISALWSYRILGIRSRGI
jgi:hypothetical protein